jgi:hypothetical protein
MIATGAIHAFFVVLVLVLLWLVPSWLVARYAARKGYPFWLFLLPALLVSWLVTLVVAIILRPREPKGMAS